VQVPPVPARGWRPAALAGVAGPAEAEARGTRVLVVDCGDFFQGTPEGDVPKGRLVIDCMNETDGTCQERYDVCFEQALTL